MFGAGSKAKPGLAAVSTISSVALAAIALSACGDASDAPAPTFDDVPTEERFGGTVIIADASDVDTFNPAATYDELSQQVQQYALLMTLLRFDDTLLPQPYLAESWEVNEDSTQVTFTLRDDIAWQDGEPTTAGDVEFTFNALKNPDAAFPNAEWLEGWEGAEVLGRYSIRFAVRPRANLLADWTRLPIMPRHVLADVPAAELATHAFGTDPIGNGPFRFVGRDAAGVILLEANDEFPAELGGRPYVDRLAFRNIPEPQTQLAELRSGGVHYVRRLDATQVPRATETDGVAVDQVPSRAYGFVAWNQQRPLFQETSVRRALTMAIDREALIGATRSGMGSVANGPIGPWHPAHDGEVAALPFAPDSTAAILDGLGWTDTDGDGVRDRDGEALEFTLLSSTRPDYVDLMTVIQAQLARVGVRAEVEAMEGSALIDVVTSPERRFDALVLEWAPDMEIDDRQVFSCAEVGQPFQFSSYCSDELEPVLQEIPRARSLEQYRQLLRDYVRVVNRDQPYTFLYFAVDPAARRDEVRGAMPDIRGDLHDLHGWWIHPSARGEGTSRSASVGNEGSETP